MLKNKLLFLTVAIFVFLTAGCNKTKDKEQIKADGITVEKFPDKPQLKKLWESTGELKVPESVMYDKLLKILYISNINGKPTEKNSKGFISKVSLDGKIIKLKWITGINAPKGMSINGNTLYVTDIDRLHLIDIKKGKILKSINVPGAKFLNDIAIDKKGVLYISDMATGKIFSLSGDKISLWKELKDYAGPNGMYYDGENLYTGTQKGLLKFNLKTKGFELFYKLAGGIDGLKKAGKDAFIVSDWAGKTRYLIKGAKPLMLLDTSAAKINAADLEYIPEKKMIVIPTFFNNRITAYIIK